MKIQDIFCEIVREVIKWTKLYFIEEIADGTGLNPGDVFIVATKGGKNITSIDQIIENKCPVLSFLEIIQRNPRPR